MSEDCKEGRHVLEVNSFDVPEIFIMCNLCGELLSLHCWYSDGEVFVDPCECQERKEDEFSDHSNAM